MSRDLKLTDEVMANLFVEMVGEAIRHESSKSTLVVPKTTNICVNALQAVKEAFNAELGIDIDTGNHD